MKRYKVLQLQLDFNVKQHSFADLAEQIVLALPTDEFEVVSGYLCGKPESGEPASKAERSVYFDFDSKSLRGLRIRALWKLYRYCKAEQFDLIIANRFKPISMLLILRKWLGNCLCIGIFHRIGDLERPYRQRQISRYGRRGWTFVGVSEAVRAHLVDYQCGFTPDNTTAITNAIDIDEAVALQVSREEARTRLGLSRDAVIIGAVGRLVPVKGHSTLIDAFDKIRDRYPDAQLAIIGEGRERAELESRIHERGLAGRVHLIGFRADALRYVQAFDIWAMPSWNEGLGLALLEGMSGSLPVIASDVPAMRPLIEGAGGIGFPPGDVDALSRALENYLALTAAERKELGEKSFSYVTRHHSIQAYHQAYLGLVRTTLKAKSVEIKNAC
ncbi:glycosyltransferase [Halopseudomonas salegens]|uniref:Glycosyltransferase involved in cell wall bisynthesis n=1 Tax=Halopseudomonas salegens TaxID=1434072 RepID=A0A1H2EJI1_9GAMM|nr:glycosyltransferase [Halopseudomonas salegens]SDT95275.1 Glycosyltransferase involved in cell wall bisynthesis [Halopseudomonas salegens]